MAKSKKVESDKWNTFIKQVRNCKYMSDENKTKAVNDLNRMAKDSLYNFNHSENKSLADLFSFRDSPLGGEFWLQVKVDLHKK